MTPNVSISFLFLFSHIDFLLGALRHDLNDIFSFFHFFDMINERFHCIDEYTDPFPVQLSTP